MKTLLSSLALLICLSISACRTGGISESHFTFTDTQSIQKVLYAADTAIGNIYCFDTLCESHLGDSIPIRSFTIRSIDLLTALGIPADSARYQHARVYLAFNNCTNDFKLFIVPVDSADLDAGIVGNDILLDSTGHGVPPKNHKQYTPAELHSKYVLDLNTPCPSICDINSPLYIQNNPR